MIVCLILHLEEERMFVGKNFVEGNNKRESTESSKVGFNGKQQKTHSIEWYKVYYFPRIAGLKHLIINLNKKKPKLVDNEKPSPKKIRGVRHNFATFHSLTSTTTQQT